MSKKNDQAGLGKALARMMERPKDALSVTVYLAPDLVEEIDSLAGEQERTRSGQIAYLLKAQLKAVAS